MSRRRNISRLCELMNESADRFSEARWLRKKFANPSMASPWKTNPNGTEKNAMHWPIFISLPSLHTKNKCVNTSAHCKPNRCSGRELWRRLVNCTRLHLQGLLFILSVNFSTLITISSRAFLKSLTTCNRALHNQCLHSTPSVLAPLTFTFPHD